jgi:pseudouridylate synthase
MRVADDVAEAVGVGGPVVALESTLFAQGLPRPDNVRIAVELELVLRESGVVPATVGVIGGRPVVGLTRDEIGLLAAGDVSKASTADLALVAASGSHAATTVAATAWLAHRAGVRVFATGGLGGVHRDASTTFDESADLVALARTPITVVCAGVKSFLDVGATLQRLETLGVSVAGYRTDRFPGFLVSDSGYAAPWTIGGSQQVVAAIDARDRLGITAALVVANPLPEREQLDPAWHERLLAEALDAASAAGARGGEFTPFVLDHMQRASRGASLTANVAAVRGSVTLAAEIALALAAR